MRYWARVKDGKIYSVESYSHAYDVNDSLEISQEAYYNFIANLDPQPVQPTRNLALEVDRILQRLARANIPE